MREQKKRGRGRPAMSPDGPTRPRQFRLAEETLAELDYLAERLGLSSRSEVIRHLTRKAAIAEGYEARKKKLASKKES